MSNEKEIMEKQNSNVYIRLKILIFKFVLSSPKMKRLSSGRVILIGCTFKNFTLFENNLNCMC